MKKILLVSLLAATLCLVCAAPSCAADNPAPERAPGKAGPTSFIVLGDVHYCDADLYDLDRMLAEKPGDHRQITDTYAPVTAANWPDQLRTLKARIDRTKPRVQCIVQLGDLSEGLANTAGGADRIAENVIRVLREAKTGVPWILTKGNHDVTGVGTACREEARTAFRRFYTPFIRKQTGSEVTDANYTCRIGEVLFVVLDAYNSAVDQTAFAKEALENTTAKYRFVCMHDPAIPATERCWYYLRSKPAAEREAFLRVLAENRAVFLCGHLHRYSVLRRDTPWGPIIQVMTTSVTNLRRSAKPAYQFGTDQYGEQLVDRKADWNPQTAAERRATLRKESEHVSYYKMNNLAGYAVIEVDPEKDRVLLRYYPAFGEEPYDEVDLTALYDRK